MLLDDTHRDAANAVPPMRARGEVDAVPRGEVLIVIEVVPVVG